MKLFGSSGIRGLVNEEITVELAVDLGRVLGSLHKQVILGHDTRTSSHLFIHAVTSGLLSSGCGVYNAGMVTTPTLALAARRFHCGVMITASHNPPQYNGIKLFNPDGSGFGVAQMEAIEKGLAERRFETANWQSIKTLRPFGSAVGDHVDSIVRDRGKIELKVVVDAGCGAASTITPYIFEKLGSRVITLNCQPDGFFPGRNSEPSRDNLQALSSAVVANGADLGIAHDGDADRMVGVDEKGNYVDGDALLALFAGYEVKKSIVVPVNASMAIDEIVGEGQVIRTRVGDVFISQKILECQADFGGEPSGTWIFPARNLCPDGIYAAVRLAELILKEPLSTQIARLPSYPRRKGTLACPNEMKFKVIENVKKHLEAMEPEDINTVDGIRVSFGSGWSLIRASGTEPKIRITVEARDEDTANGLYDKVYEAVRGCVET